MQISIAVTVSTEESDKALEALEQFAAVIRQLDRSGSIRSADLTTDPQEASASSWYVANASRFWHQLRPGAQDALLFIAENAPETGVADVASAIGMTPSPQFAGTMASIGWAANVLKVGAKPIERVRDSYRIDPVVAKALLRAAKEDRVG